MQTGDPTGSGRGGESIFWYVSIKNVKCTIFQ